MKQGANLSAVKISGHDPRESKAFLLLSSELSALHSGKRVTLQWSALEAQCHQVFRQYGYDLMTGSWFCLISAQLYGWAGLAQALDLFSVAVGPGTDRCWPPARAVEKRRAILEWFCQHVATLVYTLPQQPEHVVLISRVESGIGALCSLAQDCQSRSQDGLNNLRYFLQVRSRAMGHINIAVPTGGGELVTESIKTLMDSAKAAPEPVVKTPAPGAVKTPFPWWAAIGGLLAGTVLTFSAVGVYFWLAQPSLAQQVSAPLERLHRPNVVPNASDAQWSAQRKAVTDPMVVELDWLAARPPHFLLAQGQTAAKLLETHYPGNTASLNWRNSLQEKSASLGTLDGWQAAIETLDQLDKRLLLSERTHSQYLTISELKTFVYQLREDLQREGSPAEGLLNQMQQKVVKSQPVGAGLTKQAEDKINAILARYQLIIDSAETSGQ